MNIKFKEKEQIWQNETTRYWFDADGEEYAIADQNGELKLLDNEGYLIDDCNDFRNIKDALIPHYEKHIAD